LEFDPEGRRVLTVAFDGVARVWDAETAKLVCTPVAEASWATFLPGGRQLITATGHLVGHDQAGDFRVWNADTGESLVPALRTGGMVPEVEFSATGRRLIAKQTFIQTIYRLPDGLGDRVRDFIVPRSSTPRAALRGSCSSIGTEKLACTAAIRTREHGHFLSSSPASLVGRMSRETRWLC